MFNITRQEIMWGGRKLTLETGQIARQADGAVMATYGGTTVLATVVGCKDVAPNASFFPLTVHYQEKTFAAGRIPGGYFKREGKPTEKEVLTSRLIDRSLRPLFPEGFYNEVQVVCTVLPHDLENDPDIIAIIAASAALEISGIPFLGPVGAARISILDNNFIVNPTPAQIAESTLELVVSGTEEGVLMVESEAKELSEEQILEAVMHAHNDFQAVIRAIASLTQQAAKETWAVTFQTPSKTELYQQMKTVCEDDLKTAYQITGKSERRQRLNELKAAMKEKFIVDHPVEQEIADAFNALECNIVRGNILQGKRIDGRDLKTVRQIHSEVGLLPRVHGSALFTRGETQALAVATLGTAQDMQLIDALGGEYREDFMLHYNFPPFSVGETGRMSGPGRREIGHGKLAWRAIRPLMPKKTDFPYTIRVVTEIMESNGSSSMATVCSTSMALMDAGVPLARPIAGIAMGLVKEDAQYAVISDILGDEDFLGDMDFKVAGTEQGITALQMDIKITSITKEIMEIALRQARGGRLHILGEMAKTLIMTRDVVSAHAPRMTSVKIHKDKIRDIIGSGGKVIRELCETTTCKIDIEDDGTVHVAGPNQAAVDNALDQIRLLAFDPEIGHIYTGKVVRVVDFGAFVSLGGKREGSVHISQMASERVAQVTDVVNEGDEVMVKVVGIDEQGKIRLSMRAVIEGDEYVEEVISSRRKAFGGPKGHREGGRGPRR